MSLEKDFAFASTNYLISLNSIKKKSGKEFADISAIMEGFYDQMEALVVNHHKELNPILCCNEFYLQRIFYLKDKVKRVFLKQVKF